jgi:hypothetical protein
MFHRSGQSRPGPETPGPYEAHGTQVPSGRAYRRKRRIHTHRSCPEQYPERGRFRPPVYVTVWS